MVWYWPKPDLKQPEYYLPEGVEGVRVKFVTDTDNILLFDHNAWVSGPVSCRYLALSERDHDRQTKRSKITAWRWENWPPPDKEQEKELRISWERMFELELMRDSSLPMKRRVLYSFREGNRRDESLAKTKG